MPYIITLTDLRVESVQVFKEMDDEGNFEGLGIRLNATLFNVEGDWEGKTKNFVLTAEQKVQLRDFIKPFVQEAASDWDVNPPPWAE